MHETTTAFVGLDVHKDTIAVAVAEPGRAPARFLGTTSPTLASVCKALADLGPAKRLSIVYEAGPCGYRLARQLGAGGYRCEVVAPAKIPRRPGERIKTDRRDALSLASFARAGELTAVMIPDERDEAMRDLARAREDAVRARLKARQQLKAMLLRHGQRYTGKSSWTAAHERYLAAIRIAHPAQNIAYAEYRSAVRDTQERVDRFTAALREQATDWRLKPLLAAPSPRCAASSSSPPPPCSPSSVTCAASLTPNSSCPSSAWYRASTRAAPRAASAPSPSAAMPTSAAS